MVIQVSMPSRVLMPWPVVRETAFRLGWGVRRGFRGWGLGVGVWGLGFGGWGLGFRV